MSTEKMQPLFDLLLHADWSIDPRKRFEARAEHRDEHWLVEAPELVGDCQQMLAEAQRRVGDGKRVMLGFDFPIGVPAAYGARTGYDGFRAFLTKLHNGEWADFFKVAERASEICVKRPFYPLASKKGVTRAELVQGLGVVSFDELLRVCERRTAGRQAACALFWTLGGNQVGKAALTGWREIVLPAVKAGARVWPFDGDLSVISTCGCPVVAETYPAEAYRLVGAKFARGESKRRQDDRRKKARGVIQWAESRGVSFSPLAGACLRDGYGGGADGEDRFDATMGLLKMIEVVERRRPERTELPADADKWEGWILGR